LHAVVVIVVVFPLPAYFLAGFDPTGMAFFRWIMYLFLDLLCAETLVVLLSSLAPIFVVALALTAFANGLWMCVGGFYPLRISWKYFGATYSTTSTTKGMSSRA